MRSDVVGDYIFIIVWVRVIYHLWSWPLSTAWAESTGPWHQTHVLVTHIRCPEWRTRSPQLHQTPQTYAGRTPGGRRRSFHTAPPWKTSEGRGWDSGISGMMVGSDYHGIITDSVVFVLTQHIQAWCKIQFHENMLTGSLNSPAGQFCDNPPQWWTSQ